MIYKITGGGKLHGKVKISGNKNSVFPCCSAALLTSDEVTLENISDLKDTDVLINLLKDLEIKVEKSGDKVKIKAENLSRFSLAEELMVKLRGSIVLVGALLGRLGKADFYHPGGDIIGKRSIETHIRAFKTLGAELKRSDAKFSFSLNSASADKKIFLPEASVTATENLIMASVLGQRHVVLRNCAKEPHVVDLCRMLNLMGAKIYGEGSETLDITGVNRLHGTKFKVGADYIEAGTYIVAAAITGGQIEIEGLDQTPLEPITESFKEFGIKMERKGNSLIVYPSKLKSPTTLTTNIWPGFPTDLMSVAIVLATQSQGMILCHDWMYDARMFFTDKLITMGAKITLADPHRVIVYGPSKLKGRVLETPDIRAGMALVMASLVARGKSVINQAELIERGYEDVVLKLRGLGAEIQRIDV